YVIRLGARHPQGHIAPLGKQPRISAKQLQRAPDHEQLAAADLVISKQALKKLLSSSRFRVELLLQLGQYVSAQLKIYGTAVIRVHQTEIPQLGALIKIRHSGRGQLQQNLAERIELAKPGHFLLEGHELGQECIFLAWVEQSLDEP